MLRRRREGWRIETRPKPMQLIEFRRRATRSVRGTVYGGSTTTARHRRRQTTTITTTDSRTDSTENQH